MTVWIMSQSALHSLDEVTRVPPPEIVGPESINTNLNKYSTT